MKSFTARTRWKPINPETIEREININLTNDRRKGWNDVIASRLEAITSEKSFIFVSANPIRVEQSNAIKRRARVRWLDEGQRIIRPSREPSSIGVGFSACIRLRRYSRILRFSTAISDQ